MLTKKVELVLLIIILGSLWGFFEMTVLPVFVLCAIGLFILVLGRKAIDIPGTSIVIGLIVCFYKTYSGHFFICQWAGVMALAVSFDLFASVIFKRNWSKRFTPVVIGVLTNIAALIVFTITVTFIFPEPNWVSGGMDRVIDYSIRNVLPAALISGLISAPLGILAGSNLERLNFPLQKKLVPGIYALAAAFLWIAASIN